MTEGDSDIIEIEGEDHGSPQPMPGLIIRPQRSPTIPKKFFVVCLLGILVMMGGFIAVSWASFIHDYHHYEFRDNLRNSGWILSQLGGILLVVGLLSAGFLAPNISQNTRLGLILSAAIVVGLFLRMIHYVYTLSIPGDRWFG